MTGAAHVGSRTLGLQVEWGTRPLWYSVGDEFPAPYSPDEINEVVALSADLREEINDWNERFVATCGKNSPQASDFFCQDDEATLTREGEALARRIRQELPADIVVKYGALHSDEWVVVEHDHRDEDQ
jgi:hypothetical protein